MSPIVTAVHRSDSHTFSKSSQEDITLVAGLGVDGDAHQGAQVKHRSRVKVDPTQPNLRQVHLMASELFAEVAADGYTVVPGDLGENITTSNIDLLGLPTGTVLKIGDQALVALTGLRNPCAQIDRFQSGLLKSVLDRAESGTVIRKTGVMGVVVLGGVVRPGDAIEIGLPPGAPIPMVRV